jgi:hypothetical protein
LKRIRNSGAGRLAVAHDGRVLHAARLDDRADRRLVDPSVLAKRHRHLGAAGEVDAEAHALHRDGDDAREQQRPRDRVGDPAAADEVDLGSGGTSSSTRVSVRSRATRRVACRDRTWYISRVNTSAANTLVSTPIVSVTAKPLIGPVPN